jgi:uncharacterized protein (TIGR02246 family)
VKDDEAAVRDALAALDAAFERRDVDAALCLCADDVVFIGSGEGEEAVGRDAVVGMLAAIAPNAEGAEFTLLWDSVDVDVRGDVALLVAWGTGTLVTPRRSATMRYRLTGVLLRSDGRWLWRIHHGSEPAAW